MRALVIPRAGGPEVLEVRELPEPQPQPGEVRIRVARAGFNFSDIMARLGLYPDAPKMPCVLGYEVSGTVDAVGSDVSGLREGDRVVALTRFGGHAEKVVTRASDVFVLPAEVTLDDAAALPVNYLTAAWMLHEVARVRPGDSVLVHMAAGGVGQAVLQLCRQVGGITLFGTASASKHAWLREAGLDHPLDYRTQDYAVEIRKLRGEAGLSLVLDPLGGRDWVKGYRLLGPGGLLVMYGWSNMAGERRSYVRAAKELLRMPRYSPLKLMDENRGVAGVNLGHLWEERERLRGHMARLLEGYRVGAVRPHVDKVFPLSEAAQAHRYVQERKNVGKVLYDCTR